MKLIKQTILFFAEGNSDKTYEVDLCESSADLFVVNFRYGKRGAALREGTKTVFPVDFNEAEKIFEKLVSSKEKKGYHESGVVSNVVIKPKTKKPKANTARNETILKYLKQANQGTYTRDWKVSRIIYRALALNMTEAIPLIEPFVTSNDEFEQYAAITVLKEFNHPILLDVVYSLTQKNTFKSIVGRIAIAYLLNSKDEQYLSKIKDLVSLEIPNEFEIENTNSLVNTLAVYFMKKDDIEALMLYYVYIYSFGNSNLRKQLVEFIENIPLTINIFKSIRYIHRASEFLADEKFFALISKRIATSSATYSGDYIYDSNWNYLNATEEKKKANPSIAFSSKTKSYFNRTTYKTIRNYSQNNTELYVEYVTELMNILDDKKDANNEEVRYFYNYNPDTDRYESGKNYYPRYHNFLALMYIVYGNSSRIQQEKNSWFYEGSLEEPKREDVLPEIWNSKPKEVFQILANAKSNIAVQFALGIVKENKHFFDEITDSILSKLVSHYHSDVVGNILSFLSEKFKSSQPKEEILIALLSSVNDEAKEKALAWLKKYEREYFNSADFIVKLLFTKNENLIDYLTELYKENIAYNFPLVDRDLTDFFEKAETFGEEYLFKINELISTNFGKLLKTTPESRINALANSKILTNKLFAINLAKHNEIPAFQLFKDTFDSYINSEESILRKAGIELLAFFPDKFLLENSHKIGSYCFSEFEEVRNAIVPTIERLLKIDTVFKEKFLTQLLNTLIEAEVVAGIHESTYKILVSYYGKDLSTVKKDGILALVLSKYDFAQKLGMPLFKGRVVLKDFSVEELVLLSSSDILEVREILHTFFKDNADRINYELEESLRIFNSDWQDVIDWARIYFEEHIKPENWTVEILLYIADHTNKDVQAFARKMITKYFSEDKGLPLLLKLQEHPTKDMQFFVTNYLDNYAKNNEEVILQLELFFKISLFNINTHRATKTRVYKFLEQESVKNEKVAKMTIKILNSILGTKTIKDTSHNIDLLLTINEAFPNLDNPLLIKSL